MTTAPTATVSVTPFVLGPFETNSYLVEAGGHAWIVDPSFEPDELIDAARTSGVEIDAIVLTHAHVDHVAGLAAARSAFPNAPILIHEAEENWPADPLLNLSALGGMPVSAPGPDRTLRDSDELSLGGTRWSVLHTPGHSPGGISLHCPEAGLALVGDALFAGSIGRTDFPGGDFGTLGASIKTRLYTLPEETKVYPSHGPPTTIGREKRTNPYVRG